MKYKNRLILFLVLFILLTSACQLLDRVSNSAEPVAPASTQVAEESKDSQSPPVISAESTPPPLLPIPPNEAQTIYASPAGYSFKYPTNWLISDHFGQTIATNDPAVLSSSDLINNQLLMLFIAGSINENGMSATERLDDIQKDILASYLDTRSLTLLSGPEPITQANSSGVEATHQLIDEGDKTLFVRSLSLVNQDLYVVFMGLAPNANQEKLDETLSEIADSITLTSDRFLADATTYGLSQANLQTLNSELTTSNKLPDTAQTIDSGEITDAIETNGVTLYHFAAEENSLLSLTLTPKNSNFDPTIDIINHAGASILPAVLDKGSQGEGESINQLAIPTTGDYRIIVRGFGLSSGEFTLQLDLAE